MSPQAPAAPAPESASKSNPFVELRKRIEAVPEGERTPAQRQYLRANELERTRQANLKQIAANRDYLRLMDANDEIPDDDLHDWLIDFYAEKEKGERRSTDDVERTRLAKAAARES